MRVAMTPIETTMMYVLIAVHVSVKVTQVDGFLSGFISDTKLPTTHAR